MRNVVQILVWKSHHVGLLSVTPLAHEAANHQPGYSCFRCVKSLLALDTHLDRSSNQRCCATKHPAAPYWRLAAERLYLYLLCPSFLLVQKGKNFVAAIEGRGSAFERR
ncbi:hypothetical protein TRVL_01023 [Trypanosoma vivax]|nr:hypothetical protein TRVL_01023 [Trypanosoma vivax]